jgi:hypothetical protein
MEIEWWSVAAQKESVIQLLNTGRHADLPLGFLDRYCEIIFELDPVVCVRQEACARRMSCRK